MKNKVKYEFATYNQQKRLINMGFTEECFAEIDNNSSVHFGQSEINLTPEGIHIMPVASKRQIFKFFRDKYRLFHDVKPITGDRFKCFVLGSTGNTIAYTDNSFESYEEAEEACLEYLFLIAEGKSSIIIGNDGN